MAIPSIALIPSGYKASKLYSVLPTNGNADLTVVRNSTANRINENKLIESMGINVPLLDYSNGTCPSLLLQPQSTNLITYPLSFGNSYWTKSGASIEGDASTAGAEKVVNGDFATDTDWNKNTNWTISAGAANADGTSNGNINQGADDTVIGATFIVTYDITSYTSGTFYPQYGGVALTPRSAVGTYAEQVTTISNLRLSFRGTLPLGSIDNLSVKEVQGFSAPSVDNPTSAFKLVTTSNSSLLYRGSTGSTGENTVSVYAKSNTSSDQKFRFFGNGNTLVSDDKIANQDWQRFEFTGTFSSVTWGIKGASVSETNDILIFGYQHEVQSYATSLMLPATEGSTTTRLKDEVSKSGLSGEINSVEGVLFVEMAALADDGSYRLLSLNDGTTANRMYLGYVSASNTIEIVLRVSSVTQSVLIYDVTNISKLETDNLKIAVRYKLNDFALFINGIKVSTDTTGNTFPANALNTLSFNSGIGGDNLEGKIKQLQVYNTALSDSELITLTTI